MLSWFSKPVKIQYTIEEEGLEKPGEGKPRKSRLLKGKPLVDTIDPKVTTLYENFLRGVEITGDGPFLGKRSVVGGVAGPYIWTSYNEVAERSKRFGVFLYKRGYEEKAHIGIYSVNRIEWILAEQGCFAYNYITVPLYDTLGVEALQHIMNETNMSVLIASKDKLKGLFDMKGALPDLKLVVSMDPIDEELIKKANDVGIELIAFETAEEEGAKNPAPVRPPTADDICTICYTSGTTGLPKGVLLTHRNVLSNCMAYHYQASLGHGITIDKNDIHISYLPLAHVFERTLQGMFAGTGARMGFYQGDTLKLLDDVGELRPTIFASVPRLFNRIFDKVWANVRGTGGFKKTLFEFAYQSKKSNLEKTVSHPLWDGIVFANVRARLGGRVRMMLTGSAPLSPEVMEFLRVAFGCEVLEGYGQTETGAGGTITEIGDYEVGHVGVPFLSCEVKLVDVPEMNYTSKDQPFPRGEICFRGHNCFKGYYKLPEKTAETIDSEGWVHTGDVGMWDSQGRLKIVDRKKNIFKLAQGEYIAPEKIEGVYTNHELVAQAFVYGDSLQAALVGIIIPDEDVLKKWAAENGMTGKTFDELCKMEKVKNHILNSLKVHGKAHDLKGFEAVKAISLDSELMSVENNLLTPTFKIKRYEAKIKYQKQIDSLYAEIGSSA